MKLPDTVNVLGVPIAIVYCDKVADVDIHHCSQLWGQWGRDDRTIRVFRGSLSTPDILQTIVHELIHAINEMLHLKDVEDDGDNHDLDRLAVTLVDTFVRNGWIVLDDEQT